MKRVTWILALLLITSVVYGEGRNLFLKQSGDTVNNVDAGGLKQGYWIYKGMDIGTGKPDADTLRTAPHRMINIRDPAEAYSASDFRSFTFSPCFDFEVDPFQCLRIWELPCNRGLLFFLIGQ